MIDPFLYKFLVFTQIIFILIHIFSFKFVKKDLKKLIILVGIAAIVIFCLHLEFVKILNDEVASKSYGNGAGTLPLDTSYYYLIVFYVSFIILAFLNGTIFLFILYKKCKGQKIEKI